MFLNFPPKIVPKLHHFLILSLPTCCHSNLTTLEIEKAARTPLSSLPPLPANAYRLAPLPARIMARFPITLPLCPSIIPLLPFAMARCGVFLFYLSLFLSFVIASCHFFKFHLLLHISLYSYRSLLISLFSLLTIYFSFSLSLVV